MGHGFSQAYDPTIEDSYRKIVEVDGQPCDLVIHDTGGAEEYDAVRLDAVRKNTGGFLVLYATTKRSTLDRASETVQQIRSLHERAPVLLVGTKADLGYYRKVKREVGLAEADRLGCGFRETSASLNSDIAETFRDLVRECRKVGLQNVQPMRRSKTSWGWPLTLCGLTDILHLVFWGGDDNDGDGDPTYVEPELL